MLSQDELDALLNNDSKQEEGNKIVVSEYLSDFELDAIGEIGNISFDSASTALSALLGQKVEITTPVINATYTKNLSNEFPEPHVAVYVKYIDGFDGTNLFVIKSNDAKVIADLMLGGNGETISSDELSDMDISAVQEAMNQMMGSSATSMSAIFNRAVSISPPSVDVLDIVNGIGNGNLPKEDVILLVSFKIRIGNLIDSNIMQIISTSFAKKMVEYLIINEEDSNDNEDVNNSTLSKDSESLNESKTEVNNSTDSKPNNHENNINVQSVQFSELESKGSAKNFDSNLGLLMDIPLQVSVELGRTKKMIKDILELSSGSIIELDKLAGEPVDIYANNKLIAKGEVVVIDENFGVRITDIISQIDRVRRLQ